VDDHDAEKASRPQANTYLAQVVLGGSGIASALVVEIRCACEVAIGPTG
jgi:hypothetical protein